MNENGYNMASVDAGLAELQKLLPVGKMELLRETLAASRQKLNEPMQLAIVGKISSSKSTLVNAILGKEEVMSTGQMEVTYNVGWLKYGSPQNDIIIHHKDGTPDLHKSPQDFHDWTVDNEGKKELINNVSYIETFDDAEILRDINIIDTPGLDAVRGQDSQNTLDFLKNVRPDAVIMLFTHSVAESILDVVRDFNSGGNFNPLNAIGVLSKIDVLWMEDNEREQTALQIGQRIAGNKMKNLPMLRKSLFNIYPISSLLFLKASSLKEEDLRLIGRLNGSDEDMLVCAMLTANDFIDPDYELAISVDERRHLLKQLDLYGIYLLSELLKKKPEATLGEARELLFAESGAKEFMTILHNHFGSRSKLIKMESIYQRLQRALATERASAFRDTEAVRLLDRMEQRIADLFSSLVHEHNEYELLNRIYCNEIDLDEDVADEFQRLCGEHGGSAPERLGLDPKHATVSEMKERAFEREKYWRRAINEEFDPDEKEWMRTVLQSYTLLRHKIQTAAYQYEQSRAFLFNEN